MRLSHKSIFALAAVAVASLAHADPVTSGSADISLNLTGFSNGYALVDTSLNNGYVAAGRLQGTWTQNGSSKSFLTYCTDIFQNFSWNTNYNYILGATNTAQGFSTRQEDLMGKLFTLAGAGVNSTDASVAFQLATWEIVHESATGLDLGSGSFRLEAGGTANQRALASGWLTAVLDVGAQKSFDATRLYHASAQDFVVFNSRVPTVPNRVITVPEPGNLALATIALLGLVASRRQAVHTGLR